MPSHWYLAPHFVPQEYDPAKPVVVAITNFITSFILYSEFVEVTQIAPSSTHSRNPSTAQSTHPRHSIWSTHQATSFPFRYTCPLRWSRWCRHWCSLVMTGPCITLKLTHLQ